MEEKVQGRGMGVYGERVAIGGKFVLTANQYIILIVVALSVFLVIIYLIDMLESKKRVRAKKETRWET